MKKQAIILASFIVVIIIFFLLTNNSGSNSSILFDAGNNLIENENYDYDADGAVSEVENVEFELNLQETVFVDVSGEVVSPGVFEVDASVRIGYLIDLAGGLTEYSNVRGLNQAARIYDEMVIFVPHVDDVSTEVETQFNNSDEDNSELISLSTASAIELQSLPGIGATISANIIAHRNTNGAFSSVDELINVAGIGVGIIENVREFVKP